MTQATDTNSNGQIIEKLRDASWSENNFEAGRVLTLESAIAIVQAQPSPPIESELVAKLEAAKATAMSPGLEGFKKGYNAGVERCIAIARQLFQEASNG